MNIYIKVPCRRGWWSHLRSRPPSIHGDRWRKKHSSSAIIHPKIEPLIAPDRGEVQGTEKVAAFPRFLSLELWFFFFRLIWRWEVWSGINWYGWWFFCESFRFFGFWGVWFVNLVELSVVGGAWTVKGVIWKVEYCVVFRLGLWPFAFAWWWLLLKRILW